MSGHQRLVASLTLASCVIGCRAADLDEIVSRAAATLKSDWAADENYAYIQKDEALKNGHWSTKTSQVVYIDGSDYYLPLGADSAGLKAEVARRKNETPGQRRDRIAKYQKERDANEALVLDFPDAFEFALTGEETIDGRKSWVLAATAKKRTGQLSLAQKVLSGMQGTAWVDEETFHAVRVKCDVVTPVPVYGILAKVLPGTHIEFAMAPVSESIWLISELRMNLAVSKVFFFHSTQVTRTTYTGYRLNSEMLAELLAN